METPLPMTPPGATSAATTSETARQRLARGTDAAWVLPAHIAVLALATFVYVFNLSVSGYANTFYSMAAQAASQDWSSWFWGSLDASNFITVDKPPLATMVMGLSVRIFGLSSWSILLPEALFGVATIAVLYAIVRRYAGPAAATLAALVATLTPAAMLIFRYNNPDALLTLLLVAAAWALLRGVSDGRLRWLVLAGLLVGLAFNTKFLQAFLVLPAFAVVWAVAAPVDVRRRLTGLAVALVTVLVSSSWWVLAVQLTPADLRPYIGGSTDGTAVQLLFGYDGLGRIFGQLTGGAALRETVGSPNAPAGPGLPGAFGGDPGLLRMFNRDFGGQIAWLLPYALIGAAASLLLRWRRPRTDLARAAALLWMLWLLVHVLVFSLMGGIIHSYYVVVMAPAIGALVGAGTVDLWHARRTHRPLAGLALAAALAISALVGWDILNRTPDFLPGLSTVVLVAGLGSALVIGFLALLPESVTNDALRTVSRLSLAALTVGLVALMAGPTAYALDTMNTSYSGGDPSAGPSYAHAIFPGFPGASNGRGGGRGFRPPPNPAGNPGGPFGLSPDQNAGGLTPEELSYLVANRGSARWIVAASASSQAAPIQLATGQPVMAMGGFNGADPDPSLDQLKAYIHDGQLRFVIAAGAGFGGFGQGFGQVTGIAGWVRANCSIVNVKSDGPASLYDCAGDA